MKSSTPLKKPKLTAKEIARYQKAISEIGQQKKSGCVMIFEDVQGKPGTARGRIFCYEFSLSDAVLCAVEELLPVHQMLIAAKVISSQSGKQPKVE